MNINTLNSAERETLMIEALNALRVCIPNITRPAGVLINQNQPLDIEDKGNFYNVTMYVRAVDFSGKYLFLGPFHLTASLDNGHWVVSEPRFDPGIDGCYYDVVGISGSHLKIYEHMVAIDDAPTYFEDCEGVSLKDCDDTSDGLVRFDLKDGTFKIFKWNKTTQNSTFMTKVLSICDLMITNAQRAAAEKAAEEAAKAAKEATRAARTERPSFSRPAASAPAALQEEKEPEAPARTAPAYTPSSNSPFAKPAKTFTRPGMNRQPEKEAPAAPAEKPATENHPIGGQKRISLRTNGSGGIRNADRIGIHNPEVDAMKANREKNPDDFDDWDNIPATKSPFVPLKNPTPDMMPPKPEPGPAISHGYIGEWGSREKDMPKVTDEEPTIKPMTAQSLSHLDDWKPAKSVVSSPEAEVAKYKRLLDIGAISQDEFEIKKKQLLGF